MEEKPRKQRRLSSVVQLADYRKRSSVTQRSLIFYINNKAGLRLQLSKISAFNHFSIQSVPDLHMALSIKTPDLILIELDLNWCSPLNVLLEIQRFFDVPSVLFCRNHKSFNQKNLIREAYKNGLYDVLFSPLTPQELSDSLTLILRLTTESEAPSLY